jgi:acetyl/propionyl-CoA carboxylase alpha subunit
LQWVLEHPDFSAGNYTTRLVEDGAADWAAAQAAPPGSEWLWAAAAVELHLAARLTPHSNGQPGSPWEVQGPWQGGPLSGGELRRLYRNGTGRHEAIGRAETGGRVRVLVDGVTQRVGLAVSQPGHGTLDLGVVRLPLRWDARGNERWLLLRGRPWYYQVDEPGSIALVDRDEGLHRLRAPLPGKVIRLAVSAGAHVDKGQLLAVVEAMKVEHRITAPYPGTVGALHFAEGDRCGKDDLLLDLEPEQT